MAGDPLVSQFPCYFIMSQVLNTNTIHATASAVTDALCNPGPVVQANNLQAGLLQRREELAIACWNVRTLLDIGSQSLTMRSLHQHGVDIACLSEVRLPESGSRSIKVPGANTNYFLYHSGPHDNSGLYGVAFALSKRAKSCLPEWDPVNSRLAYARFKGRLFNISIVSVYAPTLNADDEIKDEFYNDLQYIMNRIPHRDLIVVAGDWNARTGPCDHTTRHLMGRYGLGARCYNGDRLLQFAERNHLVVTNTRFQHKRKHLITWYSIDGRATSQIDYILVNSRCISTVLDRREILRAETGNRAGSDHVPVRRRICLYLQSRRFMSRIKRLNMK